MRPMTLGDLEQVYAIEIASYAMPWPLSCFIDELTRNRYSRYTVSESEGQVVGYCGVWMISGEGHITNVAVDFGFRGRRVAEQLVVDAIGYMLEERATAIFLEVRRYNLAAQRLYTRYRFMPSRVREGYYQDNFEDAIEMRVESTADERFLSNFRRRSRELLDSLGLEQFPRGPVAR
jgi:[ribosomal protein S18]-alanine N-acetyltransferase